MVGKANSMGEINHGSLEGIGKMHQGLFDPPHVPEEYVEVHSVAIEGYVPVEVTQQWPGHNGRKH
jgi:hypothetical protein